MIDYKKETYMPNLIAASEFQDFICLQLIKKGIVLSNMSSQKFQLEVGENIQGFEIKYDRIFRESNNLYIEYMEKSNPKNYKYVESGILRHDNTWIYCVGDYDGVYLMQKSVLVAMLNKNNNYKRVKTDTSMGFLLPIKDAYTYFTYLTF